MWYCFHANEITLRWLWIQNMQISTFRAYEAINWIRMTKFGIFRQLFRLFVHKKKSYCSLNHGSQVSAYPRCNRTPLPCFWVITGILPYLFSAGVLASKEAFLELFSRINFPTWSWKFLRYFEGLGDGFRAYFWTFSWIFFFELSNPVERPVGVRVATLLMESYLLIVLTLSWASFPTNLIGPGLGHPMGLWNNWKI